MTTRSTEDARATTRQRGCLERLVRCDVVGWAAIQHKDGWWVGTPDGVTCYADRDLARAALTIIWQRDGGGELNYRIAMFTGANVRNGEHIPKLSAVDALQRYGDNSANAPGELPGATNQRLIICKPTSNNPNGPPG